MSQNNTTNNTTIDESEQLTSQKARAIAGLAIAFAVAPVVLLYLLAQAIAPSSTNTTGNLSPEAIATRLRPVAQFVLIPAIKGPQTGEQVFEGLCTSCHTAGTNGAPKISNNSDWAPRIAKGFDTLFTHAIDGFNNMPAKGGNPKLTDLEIKRAIVYMTGKSGGHFPEPVDDKTTGTDTATTTEPKK